MSCAGAGPVAIGLSSPPAGFLRMGWEGEADVPFRPGDDFPFEDRGVAAIACGAFIHRWPDAAKLGLLLECRRTLGPGGRLRFDASCPLDDDLARLAVLAGLEPAADGFAKPDRRVTGDPPVSIAIPAYNPRFFGLCLDSAIAQTYRNIEIVVCDDSPGPEIESMVRERSRSSAIRYERNAARLGPRGNFIRCLERCRGEFVKFLCDDDVLEPRCVAALVDAFASAPDVALATSRRRRIDAQGRELADQPATVPIVPRDAIIAGRTLANAMIVAGLNIVGEPSTVLFRRADLASPDYFGFDAVPGHGIIDMATWAALLLKGDGVYLREALSAFRIHPAQRQHDPAKARRNIRSIRDLQSAWLGLGLHERLRPDMVQAKAFPPAESDFREQLLLGFAARAVAPRAARPEP
ncbi:MAG TPA: glycosyltransferase [Casimicrobiaceae bacterium]|nr:glycosyltransferase [Casimicrobiaceae bacterium]